MKVEITGSAKVGNTPVYAICTADSEKVYAACGTTVEILNKKNELVKTIETEHSQEITHIAINNDGQKIVTVSLDSTVVFIDPSGTALFKYSHNSEIQCCAFSPNCEFFLTCADEDVGVYAEGAEKVQKYKVPGKVRSCAWSASNQWFCLGMESGLILLMDVSGNVFNKVDVESPIWTMKIVLAKDIETGNSIDSDAEDDEVVKNEVGVFVEEQEEQKRETDLETKTTEAAKDFIDKNKVSDERILIASWDERYRVLNPGSLAHAGILQQMKASLLGKKKKILDETSPILLAESKIPFIPLSMQLINEYVAVAGVGGKIIFLNAETGAHLIDVIEITDSDPFVLGAPRIKGAIKSEDEQRLREIMIERQEEEGTLSWFGFNMLWIYSLTYAKPNYFYVGLHNGVVLEIEFEFKAIDALYKNFYVVRDGLTNIVVKNLTTNAETHLDVGSYVEKLAIFETHLAVLSGENLYIYAIRDSSTEFQNAESVLRFENAKRSANIFIKAEKTHLIKFHFKNILLADKHFIIVGDDYISAFGFDGTSGTSWKFKNTFLNVVKVIGGVPGEENILVGTNDGRVLVLKIGNRFPVEAVKYDYSVQNVDISCQRDMILIIDSQAKLSVFPFLSSFKEQNQPIYEITQVHSAAFDLVLPNVLSYASGNKINICIDGSIVYTYAAEKPATILAQNGNFNYNYSFTEDILGFSLACINNTEIPSTPNITHHVKRCYSALAEQIDAFEYHKELDLAIAAAALNAPYEYWQEIAVCGLFCGQIDLAKEALVSIGNVRVLKLLAEIKSDAKNKEFEYIAIALALCGHYSDAAMLFSASGDIETATELLYFTREDGLFKVGPNSSTISYVTEKLIQKYLGDKETDIHPLPNLALYYKLGTSDEDIMRFKQQLIESRRNSDESGKYLDFLQIYEEDPSLVANASNHEYSYSSDYRIMLRRELQKLCTSPEQREELIAQHSRFLESIEDWQASSSSWLDVGEPEKAVQVLINNKQTNTLLKLVRILPPLNKEKNSELADDFNYDAEQADASENTLLVKAFELVLKYFENVQDFDSALYIAERLGDSNALLRILVAQGLWDQVEQLAVIYPEMAPAVHEARASALLREGKFMEALERLKLAGNNEKELAMIKALVDAAVVECKFEMARSLLYELAMQVEEMGGENSFAALKCIRAKVLVYSAYSKLARYIFKTFKSPDPNNLSLFDLSTSAKYNPEIVAICTFLTDFSAMPPECATYDDHFLRKYESMELQDEVKNEYITPEEKTTFIESSTKPELGSLSQINMGDELVHCLPAGIIEPSIWLALLQSCENQQAIERAIKRLNSAKLPQEINAQIRHLLLRSKSAKPVASVMCDVCPRCGCAIDALPNSEILTQKDEQMFNELPMCTANICDVCKCGIPLVRSALSLQILPLILIEPDENSSIMELVESANSVQLDEHDDDNIQVNNMYEELKDSPVVNDGRGIELSKEFYTSLNPEKCFVLDDYTVDCKLLPELTVNGAVKRVYYVNSDDVEVHFCEKCAFFFEAGELEEEYVLGGECPICGCRDLEL